jgi:hypothetical protein
MLGQPSWFCWIVSVPGADASTASTAEGPARTIHASLFRVPFHSKRFDAPLGCGQYTSTAFNEELCGLGSPVDRQHRRRLDNALIESAVGLYESELIDRIRHLPVGPRVCGSSETVHDGQRRWFT